MDLQKKFYENLYALFEQLSKDVYSPDFKKTLDIFLKSIDAYIRAGPNDPTLPRIVQLEQKINALKKTQKSSKSILDDLSTNILDIRKSRMPAGKGFLGGLFSSQSFRKAAVVTGIVAGSMLGGANTVQAQSHGGYQGMNIPIEMKSDSVKMTGSYLEYMNAVKHGKTQESITVTDITDSGHKSTATFKQGFHKDYFSYNINGKNYTIKIPGKDILLITITNNFNGAPTINYSIFSPVEGYVLVAKGRYFVGDDDLLRNNGGPISKPLQSLGEL